MASIAQGQTRLGDVQPGGDLRIKLQEIIPLSRLRIEIDGVPADVALALSGRTLIVTLPQDLPGQQHDIVVFRRQPDQDVELGIWAFGTPTGQVDTVMTGSVELERRFGQQGQQDQFSGSGRLGFDLDGGLLRGGIGFVQAGTNRRGINTEVTDYFLETRRAAFGQDLVARLGTQSLPAESVLLEDGAWRGASLRLTNPDGRSDIMAFALQPGESSGHHNLTGLADPDARVLGFAGTIFPLSTSSLRTDLVAFNGRADLNDGNAGDVAGTGLRFSGPIGADIGDFSLDYAHSATRAQGATATTNAAALAAEIGIALLPQDAENSLELRLRAARTQAAFFSPLNPDLITDETRQRAELLFFSSEWQWNLSAEQALTNIAHSPNQPTDKLHSFGLDVTYSPYVFTGGFLKGVTFYGSLNSEDQKRQQTPTNGAAPQDFQLQSLSFGIDKFQPDYSWAFGLKLDWLHDQSGGVASEHGQRFEAAYAYTPDDLTTLTLRAEAGRRQVAGKAYQDATLEMSYAFPLSSAAWSGFVEAGNTWVEQDAAKNGTYFGLELKRVLRPATALLFRADYGQGTEAAALTPGGGWTFGIALHHDFGAGQK